MSVVTFPRLNPITFTREQVSAFENYTNEFTQKYNKEDYVIFQVSHDNDFSENEITAKLIDCNNNVISLFSSSTVATGNRYQVIFRCPCDVEEGIYRVVLSTTSNRFTLYSNYLEIGNHENTLLLQYACRTNKFDSIFIAPDYAYYYTLRITGGVKSSDIDYKSDDVMFTDQQRKVVMIDSIPYAVRKYTFGDSYGMPAWMADKINRILSCDSLIINDVKVVKEEGAALEKTTSNLYPYVGLNINLLYPLEGNSETLYDSNSAYAQNYMQSGLEINLVDEAQSFSVIPEKTGRIHTEEFVKIFN